MELEQLLRAIKEFDKEGYTPGSQNLDCFHFRGHWYPAAYVVGKAVGLRGNARHPEKQIAKVLPYTRFKKVQIRKGQPCPLTASDKWEEIALLTERLQEIIRSV